MRIIFFLVAINGVLSFQTGNNNNHNNNNNNNIRNTVRLVQYQDLFYSNKNLNNNVRLEAFPNIKAFSELLGNSGSKKKNKTTTKKPSSLSIPEQFLDAINSKNLDNAMKYLDENIVFENADFSSPFIGKSQVERYLRLRAEAFVEERFEINGIASNDGVNYNVDDGDNSSNKVGISFTSINANNSNVSKRKGMALFELDSKTSLISNVFLVQESNKSGEANLKTLKTASDIISALNKNKSSNDNMANDVKSFETGQSMTTSTTKTNKSNLAERYFSAWNQRDMELACSVFSDDIKYDDTAFPAPFQGKTSLEKHLNICAKAFPPTFQFVVDDIVNGGGGGGGGIDDGDNILVKWHVANNNEELPFTRGCSFYKIQNGKIYEGTDIVEPAVIKPGSITLFVNSMKQKLSQEPIRLIPIALWATYMYVVFFSDWFFGLPATALEQRTWEEVRDLSLNFFLVSPILNLPFAPVVHPMLEGTFNLLLSWAALFAGFLSDDRKDKPNLIPMLPMVAGMQFLTSAFLLPYLATRSIETKKTTTAASIDNENADGLVVVYKEQLSQVAQLAESKLLGVSLAVVGTGSIFWGIFARVQDFGLWDERVTSFLELLSIDRVGSSFIVDLIIFGLFQGWLVNDDLKRRGMSPDSVLAKAAKYVPFFGMAAYMTFRDELPTEQK